MQAVTAEQELSAESFYRLALAHAALKEWSEALDAARHAEKVAHNVLARGRGGDDLYILWRVVIDDVTTFERAVAGFTPLPDDLAAEPENDT